MQTTPKLWTPGDWNALFGFGTNILVNLLVLTGLLQFVLKMPTDIIFGRILPALGLMMFLSTGYYAWLAYRLAKETGRSDVCALPSGISVPHMFVVTFVIMLPIGARHRRSDPGLGGGPGLGVLPELHPDDRRLRRALYAQDHPPRAALARHAGGRVHRLHLHAPGASRCSLTPVIGIVCFGIILVSAGSAGRATRAAFRPGWWRSRSGC
jgi:AGZA family xanthine/uracil permease-like MFS transporter